ncbi:hypothetical protein JXB41_01970 [Candidatus Woesearchaeota archaeon]|nr:hypothetical protein [Candidatus Woesearchaeota archaeon]
MIKQYFTFQKIKMIPELEEALSDAYKTAAKIGSMSVNNLIAIPLVITIIGAAALGISSWMNYRHNTIVEREFGWSGGIVEQSVNTTATEKDLMNDICGEGINSVRCYVTHYKTNLNEDYAFESRMKCAAGDYVFSVEETAHEKEDSILSAGWAYATRFEGRFGLDDKIEIIFTTKDHAELRNIMEGRESLAFITELEGKIGQYMNVSLNHSNDYSIKGGGAVAGSFTGTIEADCSRFSDN